MHDRQRSLRDSTNLNFNGYHQNDPMISRRNALQYNISTNIQGVFGKAKKRLTGWGKELSLGAAYHCHLFYLLIFSLIQKKWDGQMKDCEGQHQKKKTNLKIDRAFFVVGPQGKTP